MPGRLRVGPEIKQHSPPRNATFVVPDLDAEGAGAGSGDLLFCDALVEELLFLVGEVPKSIPLAGFLSVEGELWGHVGDGGRGMGRMGGTYGIVEDENIRRITVKDVVKCEV